MRKIIYALIAILAPVTSIIIIGQLCVFSRPLNCCPASADQSIKFYSFGLASGIAAALSAWWYTRRTKILPCLLSLSIAGGSMIPRQADAQIVPVAICVVVVVGGYTYTYCKIKQIERLGKIDIGCYCYDVPANTPIQDSLFKSNGCANATFSITGGKLPPGAMLNPQNGCITGKPTKPGLYAFQATVTDGCENSTNGQFLINILPPVSAAITGGTPSPLALPSMCGGGMTATNYGGWTWHSADTIQQSASLNGQWQDLPWTVEMWSNDTLTEVDVYQGETLLASAQSDGTGSPQMVLTLPLPGDGRPLAPSAFFRTKP